MQVIPVIDLSGGRVVHARRGQRELYQPLRSPLCVGSEPLAVVEGLLRLHPFEALYTADLDAIQGKGDNRSALRAIGNAFPGKMSASSPLRTIVPTFNPSGAMI